MVAAPKSQTIDILEVKQMHLKANILGRSPFICNRMSEKTKRELLLPSGRKNAAEKASSLKHDPLAEFRASPYTMPDSSPTLIGMMASAFKGAMRTAALDLPGATAAKIGRLVYVEGDLISLYGVPQLFMTVVRNAGQNAAPDIRSRAILPQWAAQIDIKFIVPVINATSVAKLIAAAGITAGVGDWRVEKGKAGYGRFDLVEDDHPLFNEIMKNGGREAQKAAMAKPKAYDYETEDLFAWYNKAAKSKGFEPTASDDEEDAA